MKAVKPILIGLVVAFVIGFGISFMLAAAGAPKDGDFGFVAWGPAAVFGLIAAYAAGNLAGNRRVAPASEADRAEALSFVAPPGQARLYVYREGFMGSAAGLNVTVDGVEVGQLKSPRFLSVPLTPGAHTLRAGFGGLAGPQNNPTEETVELSPGHIVVLKAALRMGALKNTVAFEPQPLTDALKAKLSRMKMVAASSV